MSKYDDLTEELGFLGENPIYFAIENDDEKYLIWLLENDAKAPKDTLDRILNNGWPSKYIPILFRYGSPKRFYNPLKSAIFAEQNEMVTLFLKIGFPVDE